MHLLSIQFFEIMKRSQLRTNLTLTIFSFLISITSIEVILRIAENFKYQSSKVQYESYLEIYSDEKDQPYVFHHQKDIQVTLKNGYYSFTFDTDKNGFRGFNKENISDESIITIGDSIVEGASVETGETFSSVLEQKTGITTYNLGVGSYNTKHAYELLKAKYKPEYNTKLIILGYCLNDLSQNSYLRYFDSKTGNWKKLSDINSLDRSKNIENKIQNTFLSQTKKFLLRFKVVHLIASANKKYILGDFQNIYHINEVNNQDLKYTKKHLSDLSNFSNSIGAELIVLIFPSRSQVQANISIDELQQSAIIEILNELNLTYIDFLKIFRSEYKKFPQKRLFWDEIHPYKEGHKLIGNFLFKNIDFNLFSSNKK